MRALSLLKKLESVVYKGVQWQFQKSDETWQNYTEEESDKIEFEYQHGNIGWIKEKIGTAQVYLGSIAELSGDDTFYQIRNGFKRDIRRVGDVCEKSCDPEVSQPCGDTCIPIDRTCHTAAGSACSLAPKKGMSNKETIVVALPCGGGFPHYDMVNNLMKQGLVVHTFFARDIKANFGSVMHNSIDIVSDVCALCRRHDDKHVILHGWSRGGYLALQVAETSPPNLVAMALFAAAGETKHARKVTCPTIFYHNKHDKVISANTSKNNNRKISNSHLVIDTARYPGDNHQCNEFVDTCTDWILSHVPASLPKSDASNFMHVMRRIESERRFAKIYTAQKGSTHFEVKFTHHPRGRGSSLRSQKSSDWKLIESASNNGTYLLIPPQRLESSDISDFSNSYDEAAWEELFTEIETKLNYLRRTYRKDYWVYTDGFAEDYLHIRFEPFATRRYAI